MKENRNSTTIKDVAELAEVSTATVSRVLNEPRTVSSKLRKKVEEAIDTLDYQRSRIAISLKTNKTFTLALLITDNESPFYAKVIKGAEDIAFENDYKLLVSNTGEQLEKEKLYINMLRNSQIDGFIISPTGQPNALIEELVDYNYPLVFIDRSLDNIGVKTVLAENIRGAYEATNYLINMNHKRIGMIGGIKEVTSSKERVQGYRKALQEHKIPLNENFIIEGGFTEEGGYQATKSLLSLKNRPTAIFSANGRMTLGAIKLLREKGFEYPRDISLLGFDDFDIFSILKPQVSAVQQDSYKIGAKAVEILVNQIENDESPNLDIHRVPVNLKKRGSVSKI